jgi:Kef-type K+ transport system membrane component KefB
MIELIILLAGMILWRMEIIQAYIGTQPSLALSFGFILLFAFLFGQRISRYKLPQITGFILAGILGGPYLLGFLSHADVQTLQIFDGLALSLIALIAGGEMRISRLREQLKAIFNLVLWQTVFIIGGFILIGFLLPLRVFQEQIGYFAPLPFFLMLGTLATATSPSTTIAVITETRAKGRLTDLILGTAVVKDFVVILLFAFSLSLVKSWVAGAGGGPGLDWKVIFRILEEVGGSLLLGVVIGGGLVLYLKYIQREVTVFILSIAFFSYEISHSLGFHPLLICLLAGFIVENYSPYGTNLIKAIEKVALPIFVIFFAISGASLDMGALRKSWLLALAIVLVRGGLKFLGTFSGAKLSQADRGVSRWGWAGFISQAGVTLGMAVIIEKEIPLWGAHLKALILAVIALNQIIGPILLQKLLVKSGEAGQKQL